MVFHRQHSTLQADHSNYLWCQLLKLGSQIAISKSHLPRNIYGPPRRASHLQT